MECSGCTLCCKLLKIEWMDSPAGKWCKYCDPGVGCSVHSVKHDFCREFECAYVQMEKASVKFRPDKCKMIFEKVADDIFLGTAHPDYELTKDAKRQVRALANQGYSVVVQRGTDPLGIVPRQGRSAKSIHREYMEIVRKVKNDSAVIHN